MKNAFEQMSFTIETTQDGSPTLRLPEAGESMHHSGGAASETRYIYKSALNIVNQRLVAAKTCVVGLGLGYIEICWALTAKSSLHSLSSFEIVPELQQSFESWLSTDESVLYDDICKALDANSNIKLIKETLKENLLKHSIHSDLLQFKDSRQKWNLICYDAFSSKTNQELWSEEFLDQFIKNHCEEDCVWTTYACTGVLRKVLTENNFTFIKRPGFQGKRDSSLALRGCFKEYSLHSFQTS